MLMKYENSLQTLDPQNVYMIKKLANCFTYEFEQAMGNKNFQEATRVKNCVSQLYTKIQTNKFWARRIADLIIMMGRKIKKQGLK
jgi:hypothetical protein